MSCGTFSTTKDPDAYLDYRFDWESWLDADTIVTSTWVVQPGSGLVADNESVVSGTETVVWLRGGVLADVPWDVVNRIVTAAGRIEDRTLSVKVQDR